MNKIFQMRKIFHSRNFRISVTATVIFMLVNHLYVFSNLLLNNDSVNFAMTGESFEHCISFGRWFQWVTDAFSSHAVPPSVNGFLSILLISISVYLILDIFQIDSPALILCMSAVFTSFPVLACDFLYWYNADTTWLSLLLAVLAVYLIHKNPKQYFIPSVLLLTLSCGIYQVFWSFAAGLLFIVFLWDYLLEKNRKEAFRRGCFYLLGLAVSIAIYAGVTYLLQSVYAIPASSYKGLDQAGRFYSLKEIYWSIKGAYVSFFSFYFTERTFTSQGLILLNLVCFLLLVSGILLILLYQGSVLDKLTLLVLFALSPLAINNLSVISKNQMHEVNMIAFLLPYCLLFAVLNQFVRNNSFIPHNTYEIHPVLPLLGNHLHPLFILF